MSVGLYSHTTRAVGTILTAAIYNSDHQNHIANQNPLMTGAYSDNLTQHQLNTDPGGLGTEILAANLAVELEQLRFCIKRIIGKSQWYIAPATDLESVGGTITDLVVAETVTFQGVVSPAQITANQNNYAPTGHADVFRFRISSDAIRDITGLVGGAAGRIIVLDNVGSFNINLLHENGASTAANRFSLPYGANMHLYVNHCIALQYDAVVSRWRPLNFAVPTNLVIPGNIGLSGTLGTVTNLTRTGYEDTASQSPPAAPAAGSLRHYTKDVGGGTLRPAFKDSSGAEFVQSSGAPTLQVFTASGTWNKPAGLTAVVVHVNGGGGGDVTGAGGTSSFGAHCSATGGAAGSGNPGVGSGGDINLTGERGLQSLGGGADTGGGGGASPGPFGGVTQTEEQEQGNNYGGGGKGSSGGTVIGGSGGGYSMKRIAAGALGSTETVTVGAAGQGSGDNDIDGAPGIVVVEEYYS